MSDGNRNANGAPGATAKLNGVTGVADATLFSEGRNADHQHAVDGTAGIPQLDPIDISRPRKRGRPPGSRDRNARVNRAIPAESPAGSPKETARDIAGRIEAALISLHAMGAKLLDARELELEEEEARDVTAALLDVSKYYPVAFDPKKIAIGNLGIVLIGVYGARLVDIARRKRLEAARPIVPAPAAPAAAPAARPEAAPAARPEAAPAAAPAARMTPSEFFRSQGALDTSPIESFD